MNATYQYPFILTAVANLNEGSLSSPVVLMLHRSTIFLDYMSDIFRHHSQRHSLTSPIMYLLHLIVLIHPLLMYIFQGSSSGF